MVAFYPSAKISRFQGPKRLKNVKPQVLEGLKFLMQINLLKG